MSVIYNSLLSSVKGHTPSRSRLAGHLGRMVVASIAVTVIIILSNYLLSVATADQYPLNDHYDSVECADLRSGIEDTKAFLVPSARNPELVGQLQTYVSEQYELMSKWRCADLHPLADDRVVADATLFGFPVNVGYLLRLSVLCCFVLTLVMGYYALMVFVDVLWFLIIVEIVYVATGHAAHVPLWAIVFCVFLNWRNFTLPRILFVLMLGFVLFGHTPVVQAAPVFSGELPSVGWFPVVLSTAGLLFKSMLTFFVSLLGMVWTLFKAYCFDIVYPSLFLVVYLLISAGIELAVTGQYDQKGFRRYIREVKRPTNTNYQPGQQHTHPNSARQRASANNYLTRLITPIARMFSVGRGSDPLPGIDRLFGLKSEYVLTWLPVWLEPSIAFITFLKTVSSDFWLVFKNSDYYVDPTYYMAWGRNISVVTHDFSRPGGSSDEFTWSYANNKVLMAVRGGARYHHKVNRFDTDVVATRNIISPLITKILQFILFCLRIELLFTYDVHYFTQNDYTYVTMTPRHTLNTFHAPHLDATPVGIRTFSNSYIGARATVNAQLVQTKSATAKEMRLLYFSFPGSDLSFSVQWSAFLHCASLYKLDPTTRANNNKHLLTNVYEENHAEVAKELIYELYPYVDHILENMYIDMSYNEMEKRLIKFSLDDVEGLAPDLDKPPVVNSVFTQRFTKPERKAQAQSFRVWVEKYSDNFSSFHKSVGQKLSGLKPAMQQIYPLTVKYPLCTPCRISEADRDAYLGRLLAVNRDTPELRASNFDWELIEQILKTIFPERLQPLDPAELEAHCKKHPNLHVRYNEFDDADKTIDATDIATVGLNNFPKVELQPKAGDLTSYRNITNNTDIQVVSMTAFTKPMSRHLAQTIKGYAFGQSAANLGEHIHNLANLYTNVVETDYSAFDGTQNTITWYMECLAYTIAYGEEAAQQIIKLKYASYCATVKAMGYSYSTLGTRHSGAADTSLMNTVLNLLITTYARASFCKKNNEEYNIKQCLSMNVAGGDDGLAFGMSSELASHYEATTKFFGLDLKAQVKSTSEPLNMLARIYPNPRACPGSGVDIKRMLLKITHSGLKYDRLNALALKVSGYITTDYGTPLVKDWLSHLVRLLKPHVDTDVVGHMLTNNEISYSARLGQPIPTSLECDYLFANDPEAVEAMQLAIEQFKGIKSIMEWVPTCFKTQDVGDFNNDDYSSKRVNKATQKLSLRNAYGDGFAKLSAADQSRLPNSTMTDHYSKVFLQYPQSVINDISGCPDLMSVFYDTLDRPYLLNEEVADDQLVVMYPIHNVNGYNNKCYDAILLSKQVPIVLNTTITFVEKYKKVIAKHGLTTDVLGNGVAVVSGKATTQRKERAIKDRDLTSVPEPYKGAPTKASVHDVVHPVLEKVQRNIIKATTPKPSVSAKAPVTKMPRKVALHIPLASVKESEQELAIDVKRDVSTIKVVKKLDKPQSTLNGGRKNTVSPTPAKPSAGITSSSTPAVDKQPGKPKRDKRVPSSPRPSPPLPKNDKQGNEAAPVEPTTPQSNLISSPPEESIPPTVKSDNTACDVKAPLTSVVQLQPNDLPSTSQKTGDEPTLKSFDEYQDDLFHISIDVQALFDSQARAFLVDQDREE